MRVTVIPINVLGMVSKNLEKNFEELEYREKSRPFRPQHWLEYSEELRRLAVTLTQWKTTN